MVRLSGLIRVLVTVVVGLAILAAIYGLWVRYQIEPVTRDGKVRADVVPIAPDVSGLVTQVLVRDNEAVKGGQVLMVIDQSRYKIALAQAEANLLRERAGYDEAAREDRRNRAMSDVIAQEATQQG
jgi:multidrug resistance efflux pump